MNRKSYSKSDQVSVLSKIVSRHYINIKTRHRYGIIRIHESILQVARCTTTKTRTRTEEETHVASLSTSLFDIKAKTMTQR
jgi:hypothetical protein